MPTIPLTYMSGAGNLFSVIDNRDGFLTSDVVAGLCPRLIQPTTAHVQTTEGVLVLQQANTRGDIVVDFYNPDGSSSMMCGNGGRCAVRFALDIGAIASTTHHGVLQMAQRQFPYTVFPDSIELSFAPPHSLIHPIELRTLGRVFQGTLVDIGSDHLVINRRSWEETMGSWSVDQFEKIAPALRALASLPRGANVTVYTVLDDGVLELTTFERGVERVTHACGTGALATAVVAWMSSSNHRKDWTCIPPSSEALNCRVCCDKEQHITALLLNGPARVLSTGFFTYSD